MGERGGGGVHCLQTSKKTGYLWGIISVLFMPTAQEGETA